MSRLRTVILVIIIAGSNAGWPQILAEKFMSEPGPLAIKTIKTFILHDSRRNKDLPLRITFPAGNGNYPVIIWSHGALGSKDGYQPLITFWASHGYVCIQPTHEDSRKLLGWRAFFNRKKIWQKWSTRPPDISLIIDSLSAISNRVAGLRGKMNLSRIGVGGHSFGAHTAQLIGGVEIVNPSNHRKFNFTDPRPAAILLISPSGTGPSLKPASFHGLTRPTMIITGTEDKSPLNGKGYRWRIGVYRYAPRGDKFLAVIQNAYHGFGGIAGPIRFPGSGPTNPRQVADVRALSTAFWNAYLKQDSTAAKFLTPKNIADFTAGEVRLQRK